MNPARTTSATPLLTAIPLGLVVLGIVADLLYLSTGQPGFAFVAYWNLSGMVIAGAVAAAFGAWNYGTSKCRAELDAIETWPGLPGIIAVALFGASWVLRRHDASLLPSVPALSASFCAAVVAIFAGGLTSFLRRRHHDSGPEAVHPPPLRPVGSHLAH